MANQRQERLAPALATAQAAAGRQAGVPGRDVAAGTARDDTEKDGIGLDHLGWSGGQGMRISVARGSAGCWGDLALVFFSSGALLCYLGLHPKDVRQARFAVG